MCLCAQICEEDCGTELFVRTYYTSKHKPELRPCGILLVQLTNLRSLSNYHKRTHQSAWISSTKTQQSKMFRRRYFHQAVTCHMSHIMCHMSHVTSSRANKTRSPIVNEPHFKQW